MRRRRSLPLALPLSGALALAACTTDTSTTDTTLLTTSVIVDPAQFLGGLPCGVAGGAFTYRASAVDVDSGEVVGQSDPVSCGAKLSFTNIEAGKLYGARIAIQDETGSDAWSTECGLAGDGAAVATSSRQVVISGCTPIVFGGGAGDTAVVIDVDALTAPIGCTGEENGLVFQTTVTPLGASLPEVTVPCGGGEVRYGAVDHGQRYDFYLVATDFPLEQRWGSRCSATARAGFGVTASCTPLTQRATLDIPVQGALASAGLVCGGADPSATAARVTVTKGPDAQPATLVGCDADAVLADVRAGDYEATLELLDQGATKASFACAATAEPGLVTTLDCGL